MEIAIIAHEAALAAWAANAREGTRVLGIQSPEEAPEGALLIDCEYDGTALRGSQLRAHKGAVWVSDVPGHAIGITGFVRFNGWNAAAARIEAAGTSEVQAAAEEAAAALGKTIEWVPDTPGFVTARVIAMIINEAYHACSEGVSTKEDINTAMKLGTNYPFGPFEWAAQIGLKHVVELLRALAHKNGRYAPNALLLQEAGEKER
ncbi:hypothetical protein EPD60_08975 [Flaviaesturariibacter flavus]|uniref:3-hydroxyacyl-CoA dehydrogenase C-terminal domain-containing protein n=1 Tax=Flaviaesturariibacter flavus TaxID=2502780 RepID=A0A4R1BAX3_9BACT|nr:3-hydroxyacyl-CoA dehydrogenase family protein [Flaviaesturariibacter flavus]TCJ14131.1 hypothetical protein EPD60_08975 [Flaviaesturariibacter flavus]